MKNQTISQLLEKYRTEGLTSDEAALLESLSDKQGVLDRAAHRASAIRRQRAAVLSCVAVLAVGAGVWLLNPPAAAPLYTDNQVEPMPVPTEVPVVATPVESQPVYTDRYAAQNEEIKLEDGKWDVAGETEGHVRQSPALEVQDAKAESKVYCNNQCEADSVIDNIRKFLMA